MFGVSWMKIGIGVGVLILLVVVLVFGPAACRNYFNQKKQIEVSKGQAGAAADAAAEAMNTVSNVSSADDATDKTVKEGIDDLRSAAEGDRGLAAQRAACKLRVYFNSERCAALRAADTAKSAPTH